jgi:hypothetical protein
VDIGERFVWGHLGKTGGDSARKMFDVLGRDVIVYADPVESPGKHQTFFEKEALLGYDLTKARKRILNIRRLPSWALSYVFQKQRESGRPVDFARLYEGVVFDHYQDNDPARPFYLTIDTVLSTQVCGRVDYWLRLEYLAQDFITTLSNFVDIPWWKQQRIRLIKRNVNKSYNKDIRRYFSDAQIRALYQACPLWSSIERQVYSSRE